MCPDKELLSAYYDGETDGKWMSEIKAHINDCENCLDQTKKLNGLSKFLQQVEVPHEEEIKERIYSALERKRTVVYAEPFWRRHFNISFPVLISAAAIAIILCAVMIVGMQSFFKAPEIVEEIHEAPELLVQIISLEDAAAYLLSDDTGFDVLITIPSSDVLSVTGEPQLIREADYRRSE